MHRFLSSKRSLFIYPHPDDEAYSSAALLSDLVNAGSHVTVVYVSNGVPVREMWRDRGEPYDIYKERRRQEWLLAMGAIGLQQGTYYQLGYPSRTCLWHIPEIYERIRRLIRARDIDVIVGCPYEGGHPDHDVSSFVICLLRTATTGLHAMEYTGYHQRAGSFESSAFYGDELGAYAHPLTVETARLKKSLFEIYRSQAATMAMFSISDEQFRRQPRYDFRSPPASECYYETWQSHVTARDVERAISDFLNSRITRTARASPSAGPRLEAV